MPFQDWWRSQGRPTLYSPGSWPNAQTRATPDDQLLDLSDETMRALIHVNMDQLLSITTKSAGRVPLVSSGEPGPWLDWIRVMTAQVLRQRLGHEPRTGTKYTDFLGWPRSGKRIRTEQLGELGYAHLARTAYGVLQEERTRHGSTESKLLVGIPFPFDVAFLTGPYRGGRAFTQATANEITAILETVPVDDVVFSIEFPVAQIFVALASVAGGGNWAASRFAARLGELLDLLPAESRSRIQLALHPCWGDLHNEALVTALLNGLLKVPMSAARAVTGRLHSTRNIRRLVVAMYRVAPDNVVLAHVPLGAGSQLPPDDPRRYRALRGLREQLPGVVLVGGLAHELQSDSRAAAVRRAAESQLGDPFDAYGPRCGLGRTTPGQAETVVRQALAQQ